MSRWGFACLSGVGERPRDDERDDARELARELARDERDECDERDERELARDDRDEREGERGVRGELERDEGELASELGSLMVALANSRKRLRTTTKVCRKKSVGQTSEIFSGASLSIARKKYPTFFSSARPLLSSAIFHQTCCKTR